MDTTEQNIKVRLARSKFRSRFKLNGEDRSYIERIGIQKIREHAFDFIQKRLAPAEPRNDGKQTPFKGHAVFKAQHATATCCRGCLEKWYSIPKGKALTVEQVDRIVTNVLMPWIEEQLATA